MKDKIFLFVKKEMERKKRKSFFYLILKILSYGFKAGVKLKNFLYDNGFLKPEKFDVAVVSIGNILAGGTGKTPFTIFLAKKLLEKGFNVAVVSRGYGSRSGKSNNSSIVTLDGKYSALDVGDEPFLVARRLPNVSVIVGKSKIVSTKKAEGLGVDVVLLDDGFQSRKLFRDLDIVLMSLKEEKDFLPAGFLREDPKRIKKADVIVFNLQDKDSFGFKGKNTFAVRPFMVGMKDLSGNIKDFKEGIFAAFCAIANPYNFFNLLEKNNVKIVEKESFFDHAFFDESFLISFSEKTKEKGAKALVCTEKDMVKISLEVAQKLCLPIYYVEMDLEIVNNEDSALINIIEKVIIRKKNG